MNILILGPKSRNKNIIDFLSNENNIFQTEDNITLEYLEKNSVEFLISNGCAPILKEPILSKYKYKIINIHPTFLPYGRGIYPLLWSLLEETPIGVTLHFIDAGIDSGEIIFQKKVTLDDNNTLEYAYNILLNEAEKLFLENWNNIVDKKYIVKTQNSLQTYRNRNVSEKYMHILPQCWNTKIKDVKKLSYFYKKNKDFMKNLNDWSNKC